jgi:hypothetical protein
LINIGLDEDLRVKKFHKSSAVKFRQFYLYNSLGFRHYLLRGRLHNHAKGDSRAEYHVCAELVIWRLLINGREVRRDLSQKYTHY